MAHTREDDHNFPGFLFVFPLFSIWIILLVYKFTLFVFPLFSIWIILLVYKFTDHFDKCSLRLCLVLQEFEGKCEGKKIRRKRETKKGKRIRFKVSNHFPCF